MKNNILQV